MSEICNTALGLLPTTQRDKKRLAQSAGLALLAAVSDAFKALELHERGENTGSTAVYVSSALQRLRHANELLVEVRSMLGSGTLSPEMAAWYQQLDYERLYEEAVNSGRVAASRELWSETVTPLAAGGPVAACDAYLHRVELTIAVAEEWLHNADSADAGSKLARLESAVVELSIRARLGSYLNNLEPLDERWLRLPATVAAGTT